MAITVEVLTSGTVVGDPIRSVTAGGVTLDAKAEARGRLDLTIVDDGTGALIPTTPNSTLAPYGNELRVSRGIQYTDGTIEVVPLGVFRIDDANIVDSSDALTVQISGLDRSARITDARIEEPLTIPAGTNVATAILTNLITPVMPDVVTSFVTTALTVPQTVAVEQDSRWKLAQDIATAAGLRLYFNGIGTLVLAAAPTTDPVATLAEGTNGVLLSAGRGWTRRGTFNRVIATGENTGLTAPVRGIATDDNIDSPTFYFGPFGPVPRWYQSQFITTQAQAEAAADGILARELGTTQSVNFGTIVLPHLEPDDAALITRVRAGINETHVIDSLNIPLTVDQPMTGQTRAVNT